MANFQIREYEHLAFDGRGYPVLAGREPAVATQTISTTGASQQSSAFNKRTNFVQLRTDGIVNVAFGEDPTATVGGAGRMSADAVEFYGVTGIGTLKVAVINDT